MIELSNTTEQVLEPGQSITFDLALLKTGCPMSERHMDGSPATVTLLNGCIFEVNFSANIAGEAAGPIQLSIMVNGQALPQGTMISTPAAANELNNVGRSALKVRNYTPCETSTVSVQNTGTANIILPATSSLLSIKRVA